MVPIIIALHFLLFGNRQYMISIQLKQASINKLVMAVPLYFGLIDDMEKVLFMSYLPTFSLQSLILILLQLKSSYLLFLIFLLIDNQQVSILLNGSTQLTGLNISKLHLLILILSIGDGLLQVSLLCIHCTNGQIMGVFQTRLFISYGNPNYLSK